MIGAGGGVQLVQVLCLGGFVAVLLSPLLPRRGGFRKSRSSLNDTVAARRRLLRELRRYDG